MEQNNTQSQCYEMMVEALNRPSCTFTIYEKTDYTKLLNNDPSGFSQFVHSTVFERVFSLKETNVNGKKPHSHQ